MSEEKVELIRGFLSAYEGLDLAAFWRDTDPTDMRAIFEAVYDPAIEIVWVDTSPDSGPFHGIDEAMAQVEMTVHWVIAVNDGKIAKLHEHSTKVGALEAVGLSE